ncbi:MAG: hypothetical protein R2705_24985 [Ilumatobacteraceae bacterium]
MLILPGQHQRCSGSGSGTAEPATNPEVAFDGTSLGRLAVPVAQVERYTTYRSSSTIHIDATTRGTAPLFAVAEFSDDRGQAGRVPLGGSVRRRPRP